MRRSTEPVSSDSASAVIAASADGVPGAIFPSASGTHRFPTSDSSDLLVARMIAIKAGTASCAAGPSRNNTFIAVALVALSASDRSGSESARIASADDSLSGAIRTSASAAINRQSCKPPSAETAFLNRRRSSPEARSATGPNRPRARAAARCRNPSPPMHNAFVSALTATSAQGVLGAISPSAPAAFQDGSPSPPETASRSSDSSAACPESNENKRGRESACTGA